MEPIPLHQPKRPDWDTVRIQQAHAIAQRSPCARAKVGAIITGPEGKHIAGEGYNGPPSGWRHGSMPCTTWCQRAGATSAEDPVRELSPLYDDCPSLHAEANALMRSDHSRRIGGSIYVTSHVCFGCAKLIANSGLSRVVVDTDKADSHRNPLASYQFLIQCGVQVQLTDLVMQTRLHATKHQQEMQQWCAPTPPPFPGDVRGVLLPSGGVRVGVVHPDGRVEYDQTPPVVVDIPGAVMTYEERVAKERAERQDPRA